MTEPNFIAPYWVWKLTNRSYPRSLSPPCRRTTRPSARIGGQIAKDLAEQNDLEGAKALQSLLRKRGVPLQASGYAEALPRDAGSRLPLVEEGQWPTTPIMLNSEAGHTVSQFIEDARNIGLLAEKGVSARLGLLVYGPPGTGKTLLAGHIAATFKRPFYIARLN